MIKKKGDNIIRAIFKKAAAIRIYKDHWYKASCQMRIRIDPARICHSHDIKWFTRSLPWVLYGPALNFPFEHRPNNFTKISQQSNTSIYLYSIHERIHLLPRSNFKFLSTIYSKIQKITHTRELTTPNNIIIRSRIRNVPLSLPLFPCTLPQIDIFFEIDPIEEERRRRVERDWY